MPPKRSITLTEAELRLMRLLWARGESAVAEMVAALADETPLAYNSVLTTVRILEKKGYVEHRQEGRAFLYSPCVAEHEASRSEVRHVLKRFFGDSREQLLLSLLGDGEMTAAELQRIKEAIAAAPDDPPAPPAAPAAPAAPAPPAPPAPRRRATKPQAGVSKAKEDVK